MGSCRRRIRNTAGLHSSWRFFTRGKLFFWKIFQGCFYQLRIYYESKRSICPKYHLLSQSLIQTIWNHSKLQASIAFIHKSSITKKNASRNHCTSFVSFLVSLPKRHFFTCIIRPGIQFCKVPEQKFVCKGKTIQIEFFPLPTTEGPEEPAASKRCCTFKLLLLQNHPARWIVVSTLAEKLVEQHQLKLFFRKSGCYKKF